MGDLINATGKYLGKQLVDDSGDKKRYKATFEVDGVSRLFTMFMPWTKKDGTVKKGVSPDKLEEGKSYKLSYTEFLAEGRDKPMKTIAIMFADDGKDSGAKPIKALPVDVDPANPTVMKVIDVYFSKRKVEDQEPNHFVGTMFRTMQPQLTAKLIAEFDKRRPDLKKE